MLGTQSASTPDELDCAMRELQDSFHSPQLDGERLRNALRDLLRVLVQPRFRTAHNCRVVGHLVLTTALVDAEVQKRVLRLPDSLRELIDDMAMYLDIVFTKTSLAANFSSLPEQLLSRADRMQL